MSCLSVDIRMLGNPLSATAERVEELLATTSLAYEPMSVSCNIVCSVGIDNGGREVFMVKEGVFLLADGDTFKVIKSYELQ